MPVETRSMQTRITRSKSRASTSKPFPTTPSTSRARRRSNANTRQSLDSSAQGKFDQVEGVGDEDEGALEFQNSNSSVGNSSQAPPKQRKSARRSTARPRARAKYRSGQDTRSPVSLGADILAVVFEHLCLPDADHVIDSKEIFTTLADNLITGPFYSQPSMCPSGWEAMSSASLVAKLWREAAQARLFRDPEITDVTELQQLIDATNEARLGELVRTITFAGPAKSPRIQLVCDAPQSSLSALISNCPKLQKVYLDFPLSSFRLHGATFPAITTLHLNSRSYGQNTLGVIHFLSRLPALKTLVLPADMDHATIQDVPIPSHLSMAPLKNLALTYITQPALLLFLSSAIQNLERLVLIPGRYPAPMFDPYVRQFMNTLLEKRPPLFFVSLLGDDANFLYRVLWSCHTVQEIRTSIGLLEDEQTNLSTIFRVSRASLRRITFVCVRMNTPGSYSEAFFDAERLQSLSESIRLLRSLQPLEYIGFALSERGEEYDVSEVAYQELRDACFDRSRERIVLDAPHEFYMMNGRYVDSYVPMMDNWLASPTNTSSDHFYSALL